MESRIPSSGAPGTYTACCSAAPSPYSSPYLGNCTNNSLVSNPEPSDINTIYPFSYQMERSGLTHSSHHQTVHWTHHSLMPVPAAPNSHLPVHWQQVFPSTAGGPSSLDWANEQKFSHLASAPQLQSPLLSSVERLEPVPAYCSSPGTVVSTHCETTPDLSSTMEDFKPLIHCSSPVGDLPQPAFLDHDTLPSEYMHQMDLVAMYSSPESSQIMPTALPDYEISTLGFSVKQEMSPQPLSETDLSPADAEKIRVMDEKTKLSRLRNTNNLSSSQPRPQCQYCRQTFTRRHNLLVHMNTQHSPYLEKLHECYVCQQAFKRETDLQRHIDSVSPPKTTLIECSNKRLETQPGGQIPL
jgi:hypothetical protein